MDGRKKPSSKANPAKRSRKSGRNLYHAAPTQRTTKCWGHRGGHARSLRSPRARVGACSRRPPWHTLARFARLDPPLASGYARPPRRTKFGAPPPLVCSLRAAVSPYTPSATRTFRRRGASAHRRRPRDRDPPASPVPEPDADAPRWRKVSKRPASPEFPGRRSRAVARPEWGLDASEASERQTRAALKQRPGWREAPGPDASEASERSRRR